MEYTSVKVDGQNLMFRIMTSHNDKDVQFDVVCGDGGESEIPELVAFHLDYLDSALYGTAEIKYD